MKDYIIDENTQELLEGEKDIYFRKLYKNKTRDVFSRSNFN